jgi:hypothetical protein
VLSLHGANRTCHIAVTGMHDARQGGLARAACERDAQRRCRRVEEERGPVDVRISRSARRGRFIDCWPHSWKLAQYCSQADNKGADADPHATRYCDGDENVATLAGKRPHLSVNGKAEP